MPFVTYAQNFEDVTLWRALKDVEAGFYIDVGASDPVVDSVTLAFSERGWRGINVEPLAARHALLEAARPRDVNLQVAVGATPGRATFWAVNADGLSTTDAALAEQAVARGYVATPGSVEVETLAAICDRYAPEVIHFLKLDCEGAERAALQGADFKRHRPWIIVVEATQPQSQVPNHAGWEPLLRQANYRFSWFDGLNRFYIAAEHSQRLDPLVAQPPSVWDEIVRPGGIQGGAAAALLERDPFEEAKPEHLSIEARVALATLCRDCDDVPKVATAGQVQAEPDGTLVQVMHNGVKVPAGQYCGDWMLGLITQCRGHHKPQEERLFHEAMRCMPADATMIELGGNWAYYSAWFLQGAPGRRAVVLEPDPANRAVGVETMRLNGLTATFVEGFAGPGGAPSGAAVPFVTERSGTLSLRGYEVPELMEAHGIERLDVLHCDTQGAELRVLEGARALLEAGRIGLAFISTHVHQISHDPLTHDRCLALLRACGGVIEAEHDPYESYSGDGLIVARFGAAPVGWRTMDVSRAPRGEALFRDPVYDLAQAQRALAAAAAGGAGPSVAIGAAAGVALAVTQAEKVASAVYETLLFRPVEPVMREAWAAELSASGDFKRILSDVLQSQEFRNLQAQFAETYYPGMPTAAPPEAVVAPENGPVTCLARQIVLTRDGALGAAGERLVVPEDRVILPAVLAHGSWVAEHTAFVGEHLVAGAHYSLIDIGANCGLFSRQVLRAFPQFDRVVCAEPDPENYAALCANLAPFGEAVTVVTEQVALGAEEGSVTFFRDLENCGNYSLHEDAMRDRPHMRSTAEVVAAGAWLKRMVPGKQALVWKSDTQGHDEAIIAMVPMAVWRRVEVAIVEVWRIRKGGAVPEEFLARVADMPNRRLGGVEVSPEAVGAYLAGDDWAHEDLLMWR